MPYFANTWKHGPTTKAHVGKSPAISEEKYNAVVQHLLHPEEKVDSHFKFWISLKDAGSSSSSAAAAFIFTIALQVQ